MKRLINRLLTPFMNMPMMGKLILLLAAGIFPMLVTLIYTYANTNAILINRTYQSVENMNQQISANVDKHLDTYMQISSFVYTDTTLKSYLTKNYEEDYDFVTAYQYINRLMYSLLVANSTVQNITLYTYNETIPTDGKFVLHIAPGADTADWLINNESQGNILFKGTSVNAKEETVFSVGRALNFNNQNYAYAYLAIEVPESVLYSLIEKESVQKDIYITDENGSIVSTKDKGKIGSNLEDILGVKIFSKPQNVQQTATINGKKVMIVYGNALNGWKTVTVVPLGTILAEATKSSSQVALISALCITVSILLLLLISRYFTNRLKVLNRQISMIVDNDFTYRAKITGTDEMSQLSAAIDKMAKKLDEAINEAYKKEILRRRAEMDLLQSQINPHFLYNTLSGIASLALRSDNKEVGEFINHLSQFYKTSLNQGKEFISVREEVKITKHYIALQNMRFRDKFIFHWDIDESVYGYQTLKLLLQPFIENIVNHAVRDDDRPVIVCIRVYHSGNSICFEVQDNGIGIPKDVLESILDRQKPAGYGISNVDGRIKLSFGEEYGVAITSSPGEGTKATVRIPMIPMQGNA